MNHLDVYLTSVLADDKYISQYRELTHFLKEKDVYVMLFGTKVRMEIINTRTLELPKKCYDIHVFVEWCKERVEHFLKKDIEEAKRIYGNDFFNNSKRQ